jgi:uncharacterized protein YjbJ (UPF0337 family)
MSKRPQTGRARSTRTRGLVLSALIAVGITACHSGHRNVADGNARDAKGRVESGVGDVTGDQHMKDDGQVDQAQGKAQKAVGKVQEKVDVTVRTP